MSMLIVAEDAGLADGNADAVLIADFPDVRGLLPLRAGPGASAVIAEHVRPWLTSRSALQYQI